MSHQRQVLDKSARLSLRRITRTEHSPLTRLQRSRSRDLARLLKLRRDPRHHAQRRDETQTREDVGDTGALHLETLEGPVTGRDGADETLGDAVAVELELLDRVELGRAVRLLEDLVDVDLQVVVELLEEIFEEEGEELTGTVKVESEFSDEKKAEGKRRRGKGKGKRTARDACFRRNPDHRRSSGPAWRGGHGAPYWRCRWPSDED